MSCGGQHLEIAELRSECHELRQANASLERMVREGLVRRIRSQHTSPNPNTLESITDYEHYEGTVLDDIAPLGC